LNSLFETTAKILGAPYLTRFTMKAGCISTWIMSKS
jgi:hypothetical protein